MLNMKRSHKLVAALLLFSLFLTGDSLARLVTPEKSVTTPELQNLEAAFMKTFSDP